MLDYRTETFLTVCKTLNFTAAAKQLNIKHNLLYRNTFIFLEKQYTTSIQYKNKELSLTPPGQILSKHLLTMKIMNKPLMNEINNITSNIETLSIES